MQLLHKWTLGVNNNSLYSILFFYLRQEIIYISFNFVYLKNI